MLELEVPFHPDCLGGHLQGCHGYLPHAGALPGSTNLVGTSAQAHLLVISLNVTKYNLRKINFVPILVSSFVNYAGGVMMPLAGASYDLYTQLIPCSSSQSVFAVAFLLACHFGAFFFSTFPPSFF